MLFSLIDTNNEGCYYIPTLNEHIKYFILILKLYLQEFEGGRMKEILNIYEKSKSLKDVADVIGGQILTRVRSKNNTNTGNVVPVLMPKAISSGMILKENLGHIVLDKDVTSRRYTRKGDVVVKLSTPYDAAYVTEDEEGLLVSSFCVAIRITKNDLIDAKYLQLS